MKKYLTWKELEDGKTLSTKEISERRACLYKNRQRMSEHVHWQNKRTTKDSVHINNMQSRDLNILSKRIARQEMILFKLDKK